MVDGDPGAFPNCKWLVDRNSGRKQSDYLLVNKRMQQYGCATPEASIKSSVNRNPR